MLEDRSLKAAGSRGNHLWSSISTGITDITNRFRDILRRSGNLSDQLTVGHDWLPSALADSLRDSVIWLDSHLDVVNMNPAAEKLLETARERKVAFSSWNGREDRLPAVIREFVIRKQSENPEIRLQDHIQLASGGSIFEVGLEFRHDDHGTICGGIMLVSDIIPDNSTTRQDEDWDRSFQRLYETTPTIMHSVDANGRLLSVSDQWLKVLNYKRSDVIGRSTQEFMASETASRLPEILLHYRKYGYIENIPYTYFKNDGTPVDFLVSSSAQFDKDGRYFRSNTVMQEVSQIRKLESELAEMTALRSLLFQLALNAIITCDTDGTILTCNDKACQILQGNIVNMVGAPMSSMFSTPDHDVHPVQQWIDRSTGESCDMRELRVIRTSNQTEAHINLNMARFELADTQFLLFTAYDVTENVKNKVELDNWKQIVEDSLKMIEDGFTIFDKDNKLVLYNQALLRHFNLTGEDIAIGDSFAKVMNTAIDRGVLGQGDNAERLATLVRERFESCDSPFELPLHDGRWLRVTTKTMASGGKVTVRSDITALKRLLGQVEAHNEALMRVNSDLENYLKLASHDLKSPLRSITSGIQLMLTDLEHNEPVDLNEMLTSLLQCALNTQTLLEDMQTYARIGQRHEKIETIDLEKMLDRICHSLAGHGHEIAIEFGIGSQSPVFAGARTVLARVLHELVANAVMHNPNRPGHVRIVCSYDPTSHMFEFRIRDDGPGIPVEYFEKAFLPLVRLRDSRHATGNGMGLAIARRYVEWHGGQIWLERPQDGVGMIAGFTWPRTPREKGSEDVVPTDELAVAL